MQTPRCRPLAHNTWCLQHAACSSCCIAHLCTSQGLAATMSSSTSLMPAYHTSMLETIHAKMESQALAPVCTAQGWPTLCPAAPRYTSPLQTLRKEAESLTRNEDIQSDLHMRTCLRGTGLPATMSSSTPAYHKSTPRTTHTCS
jgi:hypothetical protein